MVPVGRVFRDKKKIDIDRSLFKYRIAREQWLIDRKDLRRAMNLLFNWVSRGISGRDRRVHKRQNRFPVHRQNICSLRRRSSEPGWKLDDARDVKVHLPSGSFIELSCLINGQHCQAAIRPLPRTRHLRA